MIEVARSSVDGDEVQVLTLTSGRWRAALTTFGARLLELHVPGADGETVDVVCTPPLAELGRDACYCGATVGRHANRLRDGRIELDGSTIQLSRNEGPHHLHGGTVGFDRRHWSSRWQPDGQAVTFARTSPDGEEGYPGDLHTEVTYTLTPPTLQIEITSTTDRPTVVNVVNHTYLNVAGHDSGTVLGHELQVDASACTPTDAERQTTGEIADLSGTPMDFRTPTPIGARMPAGGYDANLVLDGEGMREVLRVRDPASGRAMTLATDQPGFQLYPGTFLAGTSAKEPVGRYPAFAGLALEAQGFPGAPLHPAFPSARLDPGETRRHLTRWTFQTTEPDA